MVRAIEELEKNPYFDKYAAKIARLQKYVHKSVWYSWKRELVISDGEEAHLIYFIQHTPVSNFMNSRLFSKESYFYLYLFCFICFYMTV